MAIPYSFAQSGYYNQQGAYYNVDEDNVGASGYDLVTYQEDQVRKGTRDYSTTYDGVTYLFSSASNLQAFKENPDKYLPAYGGYCAFGVGMKPSGEYMPGKYPVDPESFKIVEGKLHLFYNEADFNALQYWNADEVNLKTRADDLWPKIGKPN